MSDPVAQVYVPATVFQREIDWKVTMSEDQVVVVVFALQLQLYLNLVAAGHPVPVRVVADRRELRGVARLVRRRRADERPVLAGAPQAHRRRRG